MRLQNGADMKFWDQYHWHLNTVQLSYHIHFSFKYYLFFPIQYYIPTIISFLSAKPSLPNLHWLMLSLWRRQWKPTPVLLPGKSHGWRSLVGCSPWGREESDTSEQLHFHFSFSCFGEGNGNPLQYSYLENPRDRGAWWAAIYGVAQSWTRLKWLSSSSMLSPWSENTFNIISSSINLFQPKPLPPKLLQVIYFLCILSFPCILDSALTLLIYFIRYFISHTNL